MSRPAPTFSYAPRLALLAVLALGGLCACFSLPADDSASSSPPPANLSDECIVLLGNTVIERANRYGYLDAAVTAGWRNSSAPRIRNLGWSGDTVHGDARSYFGPAAEGIQRLTDQLVEIRPTVVVLAYGAVASFDGKKGLQSFGKGLESLVELVQSIDARVVLATPTPLEDLGPPLKNPSRHNEDVALYAKFIHDFSDKHNLEVIDLHNAVETQHSREDWKLTDNGMHFTALGYWVLARTVAEGLGAPASDWRVELNAREEKVRSIGTKVEQLTVGDSGLAFRTRDESLPLCPPPADAPTGAWQTAPERTLRVRGLTPGSYTLRVDGEEVMTAKAEEWARGLRVTGAAEFERAEALRRAVIEKNRLLFHRWRPQNETYLRGFRKREQGEHAVEIGQFDPLIASLEKEIAGLRLPIGHRYEIHRRAP